MYCEACKKNVVQSCLRLTGEEEYLLCLNCLSDLVNTRLNETQFNNLIKNGHKDTEFYLHGDFYEDGMAIQP